ncbi:MAG: hypothetical protein GOVbin2056_57 [Prokaryotic dsDNA virus sp.]|nr:MAG: hypothetical protein GOVbin2056_57 [Prokaryotic dsDNA virus sp.]|tara:strand:+ start:3545 stop:4318 length:774 start_codon:yes stop_codon:yes gene_type:complete
MGYQKIVVNTQQGLEVIASDSSPIPNPAYKTFTGQGEAVITSTNTATDTNKLIDDQVDFQTASPSIEVTDKVFSISPAGNAVITAIDSSDTLSLNGNLFSSTGIDYIVVKPDHLVDNSVDFTALGVLPGNIIWNTDTNEVAVVLEIVGSNCLKLSADLFGNNNTYNDNWKIYTDPNSSFSSLGIKYDIASSCLLYVGASAIPTAVNEEYVDVKVKTAQGNDVVFKSFKVGNYLPVQVVQLFSTGTSSSAINSCVAIW